MAKCVRPAWTCFFFFVWLLVLPGILLTHIGVGKLIPAIEDLPDNIIKGFDVVFQFAGMERDSKKVKASSEVVLKTCSTSFNASKTCPTNPQPNCQTNTKSVNTSAAMDDIYKAFNTSLTVVQKIANDQYFGTKDLANTAKNLNKMTADFAKVQPSMRCCAAIPTFCAIWSAGEEIVAGTTEVTKAINQFKESDIITRWDKNKNMLIVMHAIPYFMVIAMLAFTFFWWKGGVCCCCKGGTKCGTLVLIPYILFWLVSFILYAVICIVGIGIKYASDKIDVPGLKGNPTLADAIAHIQDYYPKFWDVVFADLEEGLDGMFTASMFFTVAAVLIAVYSCCECCCCPYRSKDGES